MEFTIETITPAKALEYYNTNKDNNRPISKPTVHSYADTMKKGKWLLNGECITIDVNGRLVNGFHRMMAVVEANMPIQFAVCRGVAPEAFTTYDCGRHRTVGQLLAMQNIKNYNMVAAIVVANDRLKAAGRLCENNANAIGGLKATNDSNYETFRQDPDGYSWAASEVLRLQSKCRIPVPASWMGAFLYFMTHTGGYEVKEVLPFIEALYSLDTSDIPACNLLRKNLQKPAFEGKKLAAETMWAYIVKSWNSYIKGETPKVLRYNKENENLPQLILR